MPSIRVAKRRNAAENMQHSELQEGVVINKRTHSPELPSCQQIGRLKLRWRTHAAAPTRFAYVFGLFNLDGV